MSGSSIASAFGVGALRSFEVIEANGLGAEHGRAIKVRAVGSGGTADVLNPFDGSVVESVDQAGPDDVEAAVAAGGRLVTDDFAPSWWVLADADGNEACVCTWQHQRNDPRPRP